MVMNCIVLCCLVLYDIILHVLSYCIVSYYVVLFWSILYDILYGRVIFFFAKRPAAHVFLVLCLRFFTPKTIEKQGGMLAFFCIFSASKLIVVPSILVSFSLPRAPLEPPWPPFFPDGAPGRFFSDF